MQTGDQPEFESVDVAEASTGDRATRAELQISSSNSSGRGATNFSPFVSFPAVLTFMVLTLVFTLAHGIVADPDIWWHLHNAEYLVTHHALPANDMYSFTVQGKPWMNHEWMAELPYYLGWWLLGLNGLDAVAVLTLGLTFLGILYLSYRECGNYKAAVLATAYSVFLARVSFGPRTILFGYAYMVGLLIVLQRLRQRREAPLWLLPPLFCLWANTHGSWLIGMILFSVIVLGGLIRLDLGMIESFTWTSSQRRRLLMAWGTSFVSLFVNPFGWRLVFYPLDLAFRQRLNSEHIHEWVSVDFHDPRGKFVIVLLLVLLASSAIRPRRWRIAELGVLIFAVYCGLTYVRFLFLLAIVVAPVLAKILDFVPPYRREVDTPVLNAFAILLMIAGIANFWPRSSQLQRKVDDQYPAQAISYLQSQSFSGPVVNYYLWGGYINWKDPNLKVFIDGRADIFEYNGVFQDYLSLLSPEQSQAILDKYQARYVLFPPNEPITYSLEHDSHWRKAYGNRLGVLMERIGNDPDGN